MRINGQVDVERARREARDSARGAGLSSESTAEWTLVASELATNLLRHTPLGGTLRCYVEDEPRRSLVIQAGDEGPGIASVSDAMVEGYSTASGLGGGLPTVKRFSDDLQIETSPKGTLITVRRWFP